MQNLPITGSDLSAIEPVKGVFLVGGLIRNPSQLISINWEVGGFSGSTQCQAWRGQYEIEELSRAGYSILAIQPHF